MVPGSGSIHRHEDFQSSALAQIYVGISKTAKHILKWIDNKYISYTCLDCESDERQYCSPGIDLPIACILKTKY